MNIVAISLEIPPENIAYLKFIIESYEGLGIVRTLDASCAKVAILALSDTVRYINDLVEELTPELRIIRLTVPQNVDGDWLLSETGNQQTPPEAGS